MQIRFVCCSNSHAPLEKPKPLPSVILSCFCAWGWNPKFCAICSSSTMLGNLRHRIGVLVVGVAEAYEVGTTVSIALFAKQGPSPPRGLCTPQVLVIVSQMLQRESTEL